MAARAHKPTAEQRKQVEAMAGYGIPEDDIARSVGVSAPTLRKYYRDELDLGHVKANTAVAQSLYKKALGDGNGAVTAAIFWLKTRCGWKETVVNELIGANGGPIQTEDVVQRDANEFARRMARLAAAEVAGGGDGEATGAGKG